MMAKDRSIMSSGATTTYEETVLMADGRQVTFLTTKGPLIDIHGNMTGLFGISHDVSERKKGGGSPEAQRTALSRHWRIHQLWRVGVHTRGEKYLRQRILPQARGDDTGAIFELRVGGCPAPGRCTFRPSCMERLRQKRCPLGHGKAVQGSRWSLAFPSRPWHAHP